MLENPEAESGVILDKNLAFLGQILATVLCCPVLLCETLFIVYSVLV